MLGFFALVDWNCLPLLLQARKGESLEEGMMHFTNLDIMTGFRVLQSRGALYDKTVRIKKADHLIFGI